MFVAYVGIMSALWLAHPLILASGSSIRRQMLASVGLPFEACTSPFDEEAAKPSLANRSLDQVAAILAEGKAQAVSIDRPDAFVIGCDQICELHGEALSKPRTHERAIEQLRRLQGQTHAQHTSVCLCRGGEALWRHTATTRLTMRPLDEEAIEAYLRLDAPYQSAGSFEFEHHGRHLFSQVEGDHDVILGLPLVPLLAYLHGSGLCGFGRKAR